MPELTPVFHDLVRFQIALWNAVDARLRADQQLPLGWFEAMQVISTQPDCRVNDVAGELMITVGGASKLVDRLEAAGHCDRRAHPGDRRSSLIELSATGRALLDRAAASVEDELRIRLAAVLPAPSLEQFGSTLATLRATTVGTRYPERTA